MSRSPALPTPIQNIALNLIFAIMGERRINRSFSEYMAVAAKLPPLKVLTFKVNQMLRHLHECNGGDGLRLPEICRFKAGDQLVTYESYPKTISYETVRAALEVSGMRSPRWQRG
jgi:hypothetical protein